MGEWDDVARDPPVDVAPPGPRDRVDDVELVERGDDVVIRPALGSPYRSATTWLSTSTDDWVGGGPFADG